MYATQRPLYSYKPNTFAAPTPDLASSPPEISPDRKTVTVHIRSGVHFSPPVNREVTSADVAYAIERGANENVANPYFSSYFGSLEGASKANGGPIPGITTPNSHTIVFHLAEPKGQIVANALVLPLSSPVPEEYAKRYDARSQPNTATTSSPPGHICSSRAPQERFSDRAMNRASRATLVRNPNWSASTDFRPAYLNQIDIQIGGDPTVIGRQVLEGSHMIQNDTPAQPTVQLAYEKIRSQLEISPGAGTNYISVNNHKGPFTNINLRKALWAALDRVAMNKARGGELVTNVMTHFLYPEIPGFEQAGGLAGPPGRLQRLSRWQRPGGRQVHAPRRLSERQVHGLSHVAGRRRDRQPRSRGCRNRQPDTEEPRVQDKAQPRRPVGHVLEVLRHAGGRDRRLPQRRLGRRLRRPSGRARRDFQREAHRTTGNNNWGQVNDPTINRHMEDAEPLVGTQAARQAWANIDRELVARPPPSLSPGTSSRTSSLTTWPASATCGTGTWDYSFTSLK